MLPTWTVAVKPKTCVSEQTNNQTRNKSEQKENAPNPILQMFPIET